MKGYESYFHRCRHPDYASQYIDYGLHKETLRQFYTRRRQLAKILRKEEGQLTADAFAQLTAGAINEMKSSQTATTSMMSSYFRYDDGQEAAYPALVDAEDATLRLSIMERKEFSSLLEEQISAAAIYYNSTMFPEARRLLEVGEYDAAATQLLETMAFACTNVITFRQLLIRYDAFCRTFDGMSLNEWHLQRSVLDVDHPVHGLFSLEGVDDLEKSIIVGLQKLELDNQHSEVDGDDSIAKDDGSGEGENKKKKVSSVDAFTAQVQSFVYLLDKTDSSLEKAVAGHVVFKDRLLALGLRMRQYMLFGFQSRKFTSCDMSHRYYTSSHTYSFTFVHLATIHKRWPDN